MTGEPDNLVLQHLRRIDVKIDRLADDVHDIEVRPTAVGDEIVGIDRLESRVERIERHLDLVDVSH